MTKLNLFPADCMERPLPSPQNNGNSHSQRGSIRQKSAKLLKRLLVRACERAGFCRVRDAVPKKPRRHIGTCRDIGIRSECAAELSHSGLERGPFHPETGSSA